MKRMTDFDKYWEVLSQNRSAVSFQLCVKYLGFDKLTGAKTKGWQQKGWSEPFSSPFILGRIMWDLGKWQVAGRLEAAVAWSLYVARVGPSVAGASPMQQVADRQPAIEESRQSRKARMETLSEWNLKWQVLGLAGGGWWQV